MNEPLTESQPMSPTQTVTLLMPASDADNPARPRIGTVGLGEKVLAVLTTRSLDAHTRARAATAMIRERVEAAYKLDEVTA